MKDRELEQKLAGALERAAPNDLEAILSRCGAQNGSVIELKPSKKKMVRWLAAACAALVLVGGGSGVYYHQSYAVASVISLDVNPSIELKVNRNEKVISCTALNKEAAAVLFSMDGGADLKGTKVDVAVNALVGALVRAGYLSDISSAILISVEDNDQDRAARLQSELVASVDSVLQTQAPGTSVLSQVLVHEPVSVEYGSFDSGLSAGKAALVNKVMEMNGTIAANSTTAFDSLAALSVEELNDLLKTGETRIPIGKSAACYAAQEYAGTLAVNSVTTDVDPELDDVPPHYEVKLKTAWGTFEYTVDAFTGAVLSGAKDIVNSSGVNSSGATNSGSQAAVSIITETQAFNAAAEHFSAQYPALQGYNILSHEVELDWNKGSQIYEVEFYCGGYEFEYKINALTGAVLYWDTDYKEIPATVPDPPPETPKPQTPAASSSPQAVSIEEARKAALAHAGLTESQITMTKAVWHEDDCEYEFKFWCGNSEYDYTIHGHTCAVLDHQVDHHQTYSHHGSSHHSNSHH